MGSSVLTSGVSSVDMVQTNVFHSMQSWPLSVFENSNWDLTSDNINNTNDPNFPKNVEFVSHLMPGNQAWSGELGQFVDGELTGMVSMTNVSKE